MVVIRNANLLDLYFFSEKSTLHKKKYASFDDPFFSGMHNSVVSFVKDRKNGLFDCMFLIFKNTWKTIKKVHYM